MMSRVIAVILLIAYINLTLASQECPRSSEQCSYQIAESIPEGLDLKDPPGTTTVPTHKSLIDMVDKAETSLNIASFYWWLTAPEEFDGQPSTVPGRDLMDSIRRASTRGVKVAIVLDNSSRRDMNNPNDLAALRQFADVKFVNMTQLSGGGVMHSKYLIADNATFYVGSSNFDWRSYTQIKEIGISVSNCPTLAHDLDRIFRTYQLMADSKELPADVPSDLKTDINLNNPLPLDDFKVFLGAAPPAFNAGPKGTRQTGRTDDIDGLLQVIERARRRIDISVMNYSPRFEFGWPKRYWPRIDDALRRAAIERRVKVRLLFSHWASSKPTEKIWYHSLNAIQSSKLYGGGIHVKLFKVPAFDEFQQSIPFARVKHDKYLVTDQDLYIGTSNWAPDYFTNTCGVGVVIQATDARAPCGSAVPKIVTSMQQIFERDFNSQYAHELGQDF